MMGIMVYSIPVLTITVADSTRHPADPDKLLCVECINSSCASGVKVTIFLPQTKVANSELTYRRFCKFHKAFFAQFWFGHGK